MPRLGVAAQTGDVAPQRLSIGAMLNEQGPAGQGLARIEFPRGFKDDGAGIDLLHQLTRQPSRIVPFGRAQRGGLPFRAIGIQGDERGFAAHGESRIVIAGEVGDAKQHGIGRLHF